MERLTAGVRTSGWRVSRRGCDTRAVPCRWPAPCAGLPTEQLGDRGVSEGTKLVLCGVLLVGGLGGSAGGGLKWTLVLWALAAGGVLLGAVPEALTVNRHDAACWQA